MQVGDYKMDRPIQYLNNFEEIEDGQICYEGNKIIYKDNTNRVNLTDTYTNNDIDGAFIKNENIPVDRFGDNTYVPLDIKGDFKGPVVPSNSKTIIVRENDGSLVGLRSGYNSEFQQLFYIFSQSGILSSSDLEVTDQIYSPPFLLSSPTSSEFVSRILSSNQHGMLVEILNYNISGSRRLFWVNINGTMDGRFHSYVDVTDTVTTHNLGSLCFIPEKNMYIGIPNGQGKFMFFENNLPIQWDYQASLNSTLMQKNMTTINPLSGITETRNFIFNILDSNKHDYFTILSNSNGNTYSTFSVVVGSHYIFSFSYEMEGDDLYGFCRFPSRIVYTDGQQINYAFILRIKIDTNNIVSKYEHDSDEQPFPLVMDIKTFPNNNPSGNFDEQRANKYPIIRGNTVNTGYDYFFNDTIIPYDDFIYLSAQNGGNGIQTIYGSVETVNNHLYCKKPYLWDNRAQYQYLMTQFVKIPDDASLLGKRLSSFSFVSRNKASVLAFSQMYNSTASNKQIYTTISPNIERYLDYGVNPAYPLPSNVELVTDAQYINYRDVISNYYFTDTDTFGTVPYNTRLENSINGLTLYAYDETQNINTNIFNNGVICTYPINTTSVFYSILLNNCKPTLNSLQNYGATLTFLHSETNIAYILLLYSTSEYMVYHQSGIMLISCGINSQNDLDFSNYTIISHDFTLNNASPQVYAGNSSFTSSCGIMFTPDKVYVNILGSGIQTIGGNTHYNYAVEFNKVSKTITRSKHYTSSPSWNQGMCGIHPNIGLYTTNTHNYYQSRVLLYYYKNSNSNGISKIEESFNSAFNGAGLNTLTALTIEPRSAFNLYVTNTPLLFQGKQYILGTQSIDLLQLFQNPYNKIFYCYIRRDNSDVFLDITENEVSDSLDVMFIGTITTSSSSIVDVSIKKTTRINMYHISDYENIKGNSIPTF